MWASPFGNIHINLPQTTASLSLFIFHLPLSVRTLLISLHTPELKASLLPINSLSLSLSHTHTHTHYSHLNIWWVTTLEIWKCQASVFSSVLSPHNKNLKRLDVRSSACHSSRTDRVIALRSQTHHVIALREISGTDPYYSSILFRKWQENTSLRCEGMPTQRHEEKKGRTHESVGAGERDPWPFGSSFYKFFPPPGPALCKLG